MKTIVISLALLLVLSQLQFWFGGSGVAHTISLEHALALQTKENEQLFQQNEALEKEVLLLKTGRDMVENLAREQMGMVKKGEQYYQFVTTDK